MKGLEEDKVNIVAADASRRAALLLLKYTRYSRSSRLARRAPRHPQCSPCPLPDPSMTEQLMINGERVDASDGGTLQVYDPSSGDVLATVAKATAADIDRAVQTARAALESKAWGGAPPAERGRIMNRIAQTLRDRTEELATLESRDNGKPLRQSRADVQIAARYFEFFAGIADKRSEERRVGKECKFRWQQAE